MEKPPFTVALLDDDPSVLRAMTRLFRSADWAVAAFEDPHAFLDHAAKHHVPVAVIDLCMPVMDGLEVQTRLQNLSPTTAVVFLTSRDDSSARVAALAAGAFAFLHKPADGEELLSVVRAAALENDAPDGPPASGMPQEAV